MKRIMPSFWVYTFCFSSFFAFAWWEYRQTVTNAPGTVELSSLGAVESPKLCGPERNYLAADLKKVSAAFAGTRSADELNPQDPPRECVSFIMQNFIPLNTKSSYIASCTNEKGKVLDSPIRGADGNGYHPPCTSEPYVNSVYNSLVDVGDCLNIPVKELLPKLYNESGLHVNTLGGGFDAGVGQLTVSALREVFMRYDGIERNPSALDWYVKEMSKSNKASCRRILADKSAYNVPVPQGKQICFPDNAKDGSCYLPWSSANRCLVMSVPESPLRNVLFTGIFYRSMLKNATGVSYSGGVDTLNGREYREGADFGGYIGSGKFVERLKALGATHASNAVLKQIIVSLGFNAGIRSGKIYMENYIKQKEAKNRFVRNEDLDFQNISTGKWAIVTNLPTYWRGLGSDEAEFNKALTSLEVLRDVGVDPTKAQKQYRDLRPLAQKELKAIEGDNQLSEEEKKKRIGELKVKFDKYRHSHLLSVFEKADELTLPEYMRIAHAYSIATDPGAGGAPGYLSFIASKHKQLEKEMGERVCTAEKYLQF